MRIVVLSQILLFFIVSLSGKGLADLILKKKGMIAGASHVSLRSGPGISHPAVKILRIGEEVDVERLEGSWYRVSLPDGNSGYVYKPLVYLSGDETVESVDVEIATTQEPEVPEERSITGANGAEEKSSSRIPRRQPEISNSQLVEKEFPESHPLLSKVTGKDRFLEIAEWFVAALCIFILGWVFGGNYYLRRDRKERNKLHF